MSCFHWLIEMRHARKKDGPRKLQSCGHCRVRMRPNFGPAANCCFCTEWERSRARHIPTQERLQNKKALQDNMRSAQPVAAVLELHRRGNFHLWKRILRLPQTIPVAPVQAPRKDRKASRSAQYRRCPCHTRPSFACAWIASNPHGLVPSAIDVTAQNGAIDALRITTCPPAEHPTTFLLLRHAERFLLL